MNEQQLVVECKKKNNDARRCLYELYAQKMFGLCLRYISDSDAAQDVLQDGFLKIFERIAGFSRQGSLEGWMKRIFVNTALDFLRKHKLNVSFEEMEWKEEAESNASDLHLDESSGLSIEKLMEMIRKLPSGYATVFNLVAVEEFSQKEVAEMLNISEGGVRSQYARARKLLMKMVIDYQNQIK